MDETAPVVSIVAPIAVGDRVRMSQGAYKGKGGRVHPLTTSVGGADTLIVELDAASRRTPLAGRLGLAVVKRSHATLVPARSRKPKS